MSSVTATAKQINKPSSGKDKLMKGVNAIKTPVVRKSDPADLIQRVRMNPESLTRDDIIQLQSIIGNQAVIKLLSKLKTNQKSQSTNPNLSNKSNQQVTEKTQQAVGVGSALDKDTHVVSEKKGPIQKQSADAAQAKQAEETHEAKNEETKPIQLKQEQQKQMQQKQMQQKQMQQKQEQQKQAHQKQEQQKQMQQKKAQQKQEHQPQKAETKENPIYVAKESLKPAEQKVKPERSNENKSANQPFGMKNDKKAPEQAIVEEKNPVKQPQPVEQVSPTVGEDKKPDNKEKSADSTKDNKEEGKMQKEGKAPEGEKKKGEKEQGEQQKAPSKGDKAAPEGKGTEKKAAAKPVRVAIKAGDTGQLMEQLQNVPPAAMLDAFSQVASLSGGALEKHKDKAQKVIPTIPAPTGLAPTKAPGKTGPKVKTTKHEAPDSFKSKQSGGKAYEGMPREFHGSSGGEADPDAIMAEARSLSAQAPKIGMEGDADPSQMEGFKSESNQSMQAAKQAELGQVNNDFGENNIFPQTDNRTLKADKDIQAVTPPASEKMPDIPVPQELAEKINQPLAPMLKNQIGAKNSEYQKGKIKFDADIVSSKADTDSQIEQQKAEAREKQIKEQAGVKAEVSNLKGEWKSEINGAAAEYDKQADAASQDKKREIGDIKTQKESEVKQELSNAEKDAQKETKAAKQNAENKKKEDEKEKEKSWLEKARDKVVSFVDSIKKAINSIFDGLRKAVKFIFDKAKQAAMNIIEAGRKLIVNLIKGLGTVLKGLVKAAFAKFPGIAQKICAKIDQAVNKAIQGVNAAANLLKKGVTAALSILAKVVDKFFGTIQGFYNGILGGIGKLLNGEYKEQLLKALEIAQIAAEIALAFATGGGSVLIQIGLWLANTLPQLFQKITAVMGFVSTIRSARFDDIKQVLSPGKVGDFLVKGLFGEISMLPGVKGEDKDKDKEEAPAGGREEKGLTKVFQTLSGVFKILKGVYGKVAGGINKALPIINITKKPWFDPFSMAYAGVMKAMEVVQKPADMLNGGTEKVRESTGVFFGNIRLKVLETAQGIKEKLTIIGKPAQLMKLLANKAVDMVLNFIITHPPSALIKAVFKTIEAVAGASIVDLIRQNIPFADKLINKIAESEPVQGLLKPLEGPISYVGGVIDDVSESAVGMVDEAEQKATSIFGSGAKLLKELAGAAGGGKKQEGPGGDKKGEKGEEGKDGKEGGDGGGDFLGTIKSGVHMRLMALGGAALLKKGTGALKTVGNKIKGLILDRKVGFKIGSEDHKLWLTKGQSKNVLMMASTEKRVLDTGRIKSIVLKEEIEKFEAKENEEKINEGDLDNLGDKIGKESSKGPSEVTESTAKIKEYTSIEQLTQEQLKTKPPYSKIPGNWFGKSGKITIDANGTWTYINKKGQPVCYPNGSPDFMPYAHPTVKPVEIEVAKPENRPADYKAANAEAKLSKDSNPPVPAPDKPPVGYTWHHHQDGKTMILVDKDIHREFTHTGGVSTVNG